MIIFPLSPATVRDSHQRWRIEMLGCILQENSRQLYRVSLADGGFEIAVSEALYKEMQARSNNLVRGLIETTPKTLSDGVMTFHYDLPFVDLKRGGKKHIGREALNLQTERMDAFFYSANFFFWEVNFHDGLALSADDQLLNIEVGQRGNYSHIAVGFSPLAVQLMSGLQVVTQIPDGVETALRYYYRLSCTTMVELKRKMSTISDGNLHMFSAAYIRNCEYGHIPQFFVPGHAYLGNNPDDYKHNSEITPKGVNTSLQVVSMLAAVVKLREYLRVLEARASLGKV